MEFSQSRAALEEFIRQHAEWLVVRDEDPGFYLRAREIEFHSRGTETHIRFMHDLGLESRVMGNFTLSELGIEAEALDLTDGTLSDISLTPRIPRSALAENIEQSKRRSASAIADAWRRSVSGSKTGLTTATPLRKIAELFLESRTGARTIGLADLTGEVSARTILATGLLKFLRAQDSSSTIQMGLTFFCWKKQIGQFLELLDTVSSRIRKNITVYQILSVDESGAEVAVHESHRPRHTIVFQPTKSLRTAFASSVLDLDPTSIDVVTKDKGDEIRYHGLPFARVFNIAGTETVWFGIGRSQPLDSLEALYEFTRLLEDLKEYRNPSAMNRRHEYFRLAQEAWLESLLRRDIGAIDPTMIVSPVYNQFPLERGRADLFALRNDGRLVVLEVKTSRDRESVLQIAKYLDQVSCALQQDPSSFEKYFGHRYVSPAPPMAYLVGPMSAQHPDMELLRTTLHERYEMYVYELNENWRERVVVSRVRLLGKDSVRE
jgi:hypothetical protein